MSQWLLLAAIGSQLLARSYWHHTLLTVLGSLCAFRPDCSMAWHHQWSSGSNSWDGEWQSGNAWPAETQGWGSNKRESDKGRDRFKNVTSLGAAGKHCLPLEDRKTLLMTLLMELNPEPPVLCKIALASWGAMTTMAVLFLLTRCRPRMSIRVLRDEAGMFTIDDAARQLVVTVKSLHQPKALVDPWLVPDPSPDSEQFGFTYFGTMGPNLVHR